MIGTPHSHGVFTKRICRQKACISNLPYFKVLFTAIKSKNKNKNKKMFISINNDVTNLHKYIMK